MTARIEYTLPLGALVLCGGRSKRMGVDKANLDFHGEALLRVTLSRLAAVVDPDDIVVVAAVDQELPSLPSGVRVVRDETPYAGPLAALAIGLRALPRHVKLAAAVGCDTPLLSAPLLKTLAHRLENFDVVLPLIDGQVQPLVAVYRRDLEGMIGELLAAGKSSLQALIIRSRSRVVLKDTLREFDPELLSFRGCNTPEEYAALCTMGFQPVVPGENTTG